MLIIYNQIMKKNFMLKMEQIFKKIWIIENNPIETIIMLKGNIIKKISIIKCKISKIFLTQKNHTKNKTLIIILILLIILIIIILLIILLIIILLIMIIILLITVIILLITVIILLIMVIILLIIILPIRIILCRLQMLLITINQTS